MFYSIEYESFITRNPLLILYNNGIGKITKECYMKNNVQSICEKSNLLK